MIIAKVFLAIRETLAYGAIALLMGFVSEQFAKLFPESHTLLMVRGRCNSERDRIGISIRCNQSWRSKK
ncbi:MAG TPA: hypothetical protein VGL89_10325 [Candidatus Koribacter sp.]|jgi:hypothetical protein